MVQGIDVEIAKVDLAGRAGRLGSKDRLGVGEDVMEKIELDILASERFSVVALDGKGLSAEISYAERWMSTVERERDGCIQRNGIVQPARRGLCHESRRKERT